MQGTFVEMSSYSLGQQWGSTWGSNGGTFGALLILDEPSGYGGSGSGAHSLHNLYIYSVFLCASRGKKERYKGIKT